MSPCWASIFSVSHHLQLWFFLCCFLDLWVFLEALRYLQWWWTSMCITKYEIYVLGMIGKGIFWLVILSLSTSFFLSYRVLAAHILDTWNMFVVLQVLNCTQSANPLKTIKCRFYLWLRNSLTTDTFLSSITLFLWSLLRHGQLRPFSDSHPEIISDTVSVWICWLKTEVGCILAKKWGLNISSGWFVRLTSLPMDLL